jgi:hypothetical protein
MSRFIEQNVFSFSTRPSETGVGNFLPTDAPRHGSAFEHSADPPHWRSCSRDTHTHAETRQIHTADPCGCRGARAMRLGRAGSLASAKCTKHASMPQDAARSSRVGKIARATRNQTHPAAKCILRVHSSSAGRGRRVSAARRAWRQCKTDALQVGHIVELHIMKTRSHIEKTNMRSHQSILLTNWSGAAHGGRKTRVHATRSLLLI